MLAPDVNSPEFKKIIEANKNNPFFQNIRPYKDDVLDTLFMAAVSKSLAEQLEFFFFIYENKEIIGNNELILANLPFTSAELTDFLAEAEKTSREQGKTEKADLIKQAKEKYENLYKMFSTVKKEYLKYFARLYINDPQKLQEIVDQLVTKPK